MQRKQLEKEMILEGLSVYWSVHDPFTASTGAESNPLPIGILDGVGTPVEVEIEGDIVLQSLDCVVRLQMQAGGADAMLSVHASVPLLAVHLQPHQVTVPPFTNHLPPY